MEGRSTACQKPPERPMPSSHSRPCLPPHLLCGMGFCSPPPGQADANPNSTAAPQASPKLEPDGQRRAAPSRPGPSTCQPLLPCPEGLCSTHPSSAGDWDQDAPCTLLPHAPSPRAAPREEENRALFSPVGFR